MSWNEAERKRLQVERQILKKYFPSFQWHNQAERKYTRIEGQLQTNRSNRFGIRVYVPPKYPYELPDMVITTPNPIRDYHYRDLRDYGASSEMHLLSTRDGYARICHYREWEPNLTLYYVLLKGRIWLEAFEGHKQTGKELSAYLRHVR